MSEDKVGMSGAEGQLGGEGAVLFTPTGSSVLYMGGAEENWGCGGLGEGGRNVGEAEGGG